MAELTGSPGFAAPRKQDTTSGRRAATIEMIATVGLTMALVVAVTAVSLGNRSLARGALVPRGAVQNPARMLLDQTDDWLSVGARFSVRPQ
jgi:ABC-type molybdenum transport system ATPase subunit/photorepair protein PhrA